MSEVRAIEDLFGELIELEDVDQRQAYLDKACGDDQPLRAQLEKLLADHERAGSFLRQGELNATLDLPISEKIGTRIGPYKLLQQIGEGGMGVVYMAEQTEPVKRRVALKIIKPGMDTGQVIARFEAERQALALMDHPNIAKVLDAGAAESGRPYFVMELVNGIPITDYCDEHHLTLRERLALFVPVCQAVQHAHQKGVIHRDLKPSNILIAEYDHEAVPKIIDFGVAKATSQQLTDKTLFTEFGQIIGTLEYAAPEQAKRNQLDIDTRSDIYSLGVVLYELLAGDTPFGRERLRSAALDEMLQMLREEEPPPPSTRLSTSATLPAVAANRKIEPAKLSKAVRREPDWIVMKSLDKDRDRRYQTASSFAEDIQNFLADEPVQAGPPSITYQLQKSFRRHRTAWLTSAVVLVALVSGLAAALVGMGKARVAQAETAEALVIAELARNEADKSRLESEDSAEIATAEADRAERAMDLLLNVLSRTGNPVTGREYTVSEVVRELAESLLAEFEPSKNASQTVPHNTLAKIHFVIGRSHFVSREFDLAEKHLTKAASFANSATTAGLQLSDVDRIRILSLLGACCFYLGDIENAEVHLAQARKLFDDVRELFDDVRVLRYIEEIPYLTLSWTSKAKGDSVAAQKHWDKAIEAAIDIFGENPGKWFGVARRLVGDNRLDLAEFSLCVVLQLNDSHHTARKHLGFVYRSQGRQAEARLLFEHNLKLARAQEDEDSESVAWYSCRISRTYCDVQDFSTAADLLEPLVKNLEFMERLEGRGVHWATRFELAYLLERLGNDADASELRKGLVTELTELIAAGRISFDRWDNLALLDCEVRASKDLDLHEFLPRLDQLYAHASQVDSKSAVARCYGLAYERAGSLQDAIKWYEVAAATRQFYNETYHLDDVEHALLDLYQRTEQLAAGEEFFDQLLAARRSQLHPNHPSLAFTKVLLARTLILQDVKLEKAKSLLNEARQLLEANELTPDTVLHEIDDLLAEVQEKQNS